jgi:predicted RecA/RadA family phage recombinase
MSNKRVQNGRSIDVTLGADITAGAPIVVGNLVAVASVDGLTGETIACRVSEVHNLPKVDAAVIAQGERVIFDVSAGADGEVDDENATPAAGDVSNFGVAWEAKGATTGEDIAVLLTPGTGTVT